MRSVPLLMIPGPTPVDARILRALSQDTLSFTSKEFAQILLDTIADLKAVMQTRGAVIIMAGSGTLGLESAIVNTLQVGDRVLALNHGKWGERFAKIAQRYGAEVRELLTEPGEIVPLSTVESELKQQRYKAVLVTHVETSTGVRAPVAEIARLARRYDALCLVDGVSSTGAVREPMDDWGIDVLVTASQKALGCPPGLAMVGIGPKSLQIRRERESIPNYYGDWLEFLRVLQNPTAETHVTHPVNMIYALREGLRFILGDGLEKRIAQHERWARAVRAALRALGFQLLAREEIAASTVTVALYPTGVLDVPFRAGVEQRGVVVAPCSGVLSGKGVRLGHMGNVTDLDIIGGISVLEQVLLEMGRSDILGKGVAAAETALQ
ncbi:MAG: alanine--glyoxylate aminotransferase family protein [Chloroflexi bacterium]|nr:alanine--glyoxylate aminotransferase family protein [Chloroflexota bacterium]MCL5075266.1 alanine--glyoxylate aminotransferase family protein [Chloroflexota bacterium]